MSEEIPLDALKAIAHPVRFRILQTLAGKECNVGEIEEASKIGQPALSQQLAVLRKSEIVLTRKDAKLVFYRLNQDRLSDIAAAIAGLVGNPDLQAEAVQTARAASPGAANFARLT